MSYQRSSNSYAALFESIAAQAVIMRQQSMFGTASINVFVIRNISAVIDLASDSARQDMLDFLTKVLASDPSVSVMVHELVEVFVGIVTDAKTVFADGWLVSTIFQRIEQLNEASRNRFLDNVTQSSIGYRVNVLGPVTRALLETHFNGKNSSQSIFLQMVYALAVNAHHDEQSKVFNVLLEDPKYYPLYLVALQKIRLGKPERYESILYCSLSSNRALPRNNRPVEECAGEVSEAIKTLTRMSGRTKDEGSVAINARMIDFFCSLAGEPRMQLLEAWKTMDADGMHRKKLETLANRLEAEVPKKQTDPQIMVVPENFEERFPLVKLAPEC